MRRFALQPPAGFRSPDAYVGRMQWLRADRLAVTFLNRTQRAAITVLCDGPRFLCTAVHTEHATSGGGVVLANEAILYGEVAVAGPSVKSAAGVDLNDGDVNVQAERSNTVSHYAGPPPTLLLPNEFTAGAFIIKRLPVSESFSETYNNHRNENDESINSYRHAVLVPCSEGNVAVNTRRVIPLTSGPFEVTELLGWDGDSGTLYMMATPPRKPSERHLYRIQVRFNRTTSSGGVLRNRFRVSASRPMCMTCENGAQTFRLPNPSIHIAATDATANGTITTTPTTTTTKSDGLLTDGWSDDVNEDYDSDADDEPALPRNNCLYNRIAFSTGFGHYVQECLGPESPAAYLVETATQHKVRILDDGDELRQQLASVAIPQVYTLDVEIRDGFHAQVRLLLPPGLREDEDVQFPLVLHM